MPEKIVYKYRKSKEGFQLKNIKCPVCGGTINWTKVVQLKNWNGIIILLAECWSGYVSQDEPRHLFLIEIESEDLPMVQIKKIKGRK